VSGSERSGDGGSRPRLLRSGSRLGSVPPWSNRLGPRCVVGEYAVGHAPSRNRPGSRYLFGSYRVLFLFGTVLMGLVERRG
jgi:hypothetical protein